MSLKERTTGNNEQKIVYIQSIGFVKQQEVERQHVPQPNATLFRKRQPLSPDPNTTQFSIHFRSELWARPHCVFRECYPLIVVTFHDLVSPPITAPLFCVAFRKKQLTILPVLRIPTRLFPIHNSRNLSRPRSTRDDDIPQVEIAVREADSTCVGQEAAIWVWWPL